MMSKKWFIFIGGLTFFFGMILAMGTQTTRPVTTATAQPIPLRAPAPSYTPARTTPVATTAVSQPNPIPEPAPRPDGVTVNNPPVDTRATGQLSGFIFLVTVLIVVGVGLSWQQRQQIARRSYAQPRLAKGIQS
jgi:hypothetical protein